MADNPHSDLSPLEQDQRRIACIRQLGKECRLPESLVNHLIVQGYDEHMAVAAARSWRDAGHWAGPDGTSWGAPPPPPPPAPAEESA